MNDIFIVLQFSTDDGENKFSVIFALLSRDQIGDSIESVISTAGYVTGTIISGVPGKSQSQVIDPVTRHVDEGISKESFSTIISFNEDQVNCAGCNGGKGLHTGIR